MDRLVILDDSLTVCALLRRLLEREWWVVETYLRPLPAMKALWQAETPPSALLLDIGLPNLDGYQVAQLIRSKAPELLRSLPIIGLSARDGVMDRVKARLAGMNGYVTKPFDPDQLIALLELYRQQRPHNVC